MRTLEGLSIGLSISDAPDRARLGLPLREVDRTLFTICTVLVRAGARIVYAGNLEPTGFTFSIFRHLAGAYASSASAPFVHLVPEPVLRGASFDGLVFALREGAAIVETLIHLEGSGLLPIRAVEGGLRIGKGQSRVRLTDDAQFKGWLGQKPILDSVSAYSSARKALTDISDARVLLGGKMGLIDHPGDTYQGAVPGIVEEAILAFEAGMPCVPLGAYGGAARDVAIALALLDVSKRVPRGRQLSTYQPSIERVAEFRDAIPTELRPALTELAQDDRGEPMAYDLAAALRAWLD